ncbi:unnamed protein product [Clonostachys rosea]|uniref:FAD dependent oxidoreductase domain-containing protein n=1 Tax=Bionectria ochroleuca TaxID=29856 RepID=A0ABY6U1J1_BIOOC|nr:unnamed protein product [Clonostachys rosea]
MGHVSSKLRNKAAKVRSMIKILKEISTDFEYALNRASDSPGIPRSNPTEPYWLDDPPYPELTNIQSRQRLPDFVDVAIIGSGIAGASIARSLLHERRRRGVDLDKKVVVFEARDLCSGATGRNGGHIKPSPYDTFAQLSTFMPKDRAAALTRFQASHIDYLIELCREEGIDIAEAREVETVDFFVDEEMFHDAVGDVEESRKWLPEVQVFEWEKEDVLQQFGVNEGVVGAISQRAGTIWAYRFVVSIWKQLLEDFPSQLIIQTNTPVTYISAGPSAPGFPFAVQTPSGVILARHVIHATNAFASELVPGLRRKITGARAHMSSQRPGDGFPETWGQRSWSVIYPGGFDYVTQRPSEIDGDVPGDILLGGGFRRSAKSGVDQMGVYDDSAYPKALAASHISGIFPSIFHPNWGSGGELKKVWTGILGMTGDRLPLVGRLDEGLTTRIIDQQHKTSEMDRTSPGEWIAAGYSGEGMVFAWLCGVALGIMVAGSEQEDIPQAPGRPGGMLQDWFPPELLISPQRLRNTDVALLFQGE